MKTEMDPLYKFWSAGWDAAEAGEPRTPPDLKKEQRAAWLEGFDAFSETN